MCARGRALSEPRVSPDGTLIAYVVTAAGRGALAVVPVAGGPEVVVTSDPPPPAAVHGGGVFDWAPSSDALVYVGADELLHYQPICGGPPRTVVDDGPVAAPAVSPDGTRVAYGRDGRHIAVASLFPGAPWPMRLSGPTVCGPVGSGPVGSGSTGSGPLGSGPIGSDPPDFVFDPVWSPDGARVAWHEWDAPAMPWDDSRIVVARADGAGRPEVVRTGTAAVGQPRFAADGTLAFLCDAHGWLNLWQAGADGGEPRPLLEERAEHGAPAWGPGQRSFAWSPDSRRLAFCRNEGGFGRLCVLDLECGSVGELDRGVYSWLSWAGELLVGIRSGARTPDQVVVLDTCAPRCTGSRHTVARGPLAGFAASGLVEPELVSWAGENVPGVGGTVHGRLYRTNKEPDRGHGPPLLISIHGGPTGQDGVVFNTRVAYFCDRGFNVLTVDYRGSTGWGRAYTQALRGEWGRLDVADVAAAMRAAADQGWGHARRMVPMGSSAGGLTVLLLLALHPELCAAGVDLYGVTDLLNLDGATNRFEAHYLRTLVGELPAAVDRYRERSPINMARGIGGPLLVLHGSADPVVPQAQSDALVGAVRAGGGDVEYHVYEGAGHGWRAPDLVEDELERTWAFLRRAVLRRR
jgi:dipeptidyl aminopeptidase/acylaminoacyl peptidase